MKVKTVAEHIEDEETALIQPEDFEVKAEDKSINGKWMFRGWAEEMRKIINEQIIKLPWLLPLLKRGASV